MVKLTFNYRKLLKSTYHMTIHSLPPYIRMYQIHSWLVSKHIRVEINKTKLFLFHCVHIGHPSLAWNLKFGWKSQLS